MTRATTIFYDVVTRCVVIEMDEDVAILGPFKNQVEAMTAAEKHVNCKIEETLTAKIDNFGGS